MLLRLKHISALLVGLVTISVLALQHFAIKTEKDSMVKAYVVDISDTFKAHQNGKDPPLQEAGNCRRFERFYLFIVRSIYQVYDKYIYIYIFFFFFSAELSLTNKELSLVTYE